MSRVTLATVRTIARALPGVEEVTSYGTPGFKVKGKFLARVWEDNEVLVVKCGDDERDFRMKAKPQTFFITDHYRGYHIVLIHLNKVTRTELEEVLEQAWRQNAPKRLIAQSGKSR